MRIEGATQQLNIINSQHKSEVPREEIGVKNNNKPTQKQTAEEKVINEKDLIKSIEKANEALNLRYTTLEFSIHEKTKEIMVKVIDRDSGELIREIPPEKILDAVAHMWEIAGIIVDEKR
jgi:flagellar protein FlaG